MTVVADLMERDVITVRPNASIADLIFRLEASGVSGLPVVDEQGVLVGIVSQRDVIRLASELDRVPEAMLWGLGRAVPPRDLGSLEAPVAGEFFAYYVTPSGGFVDLRDRIRELPSDAFDGYRVEDVMTRAPFTVEVDTTLTELARRLLGWKVHRALVLEDGKLVGIVTTTDILKALAEA